MINYLSGHRKTTRPSKTEDVYNTSWRIKMVEKWTKEQEEEVRKAAFEVVFELLETYPEFRETKQLLFDYMGLSCPIFFRRCQPKRINIRLQCK